MCKKIDINVKLEILPPANRVGKAASVKQHPGDFSLRYFFPILNIFFYQHLFRRIQCSASINEMLTERLFGITKYSTTNIKYFVSNI